MLAKLRRRFILITMALVSLVLLGVLLVNIASNYQSGLAAVSSALDRSMERDLQGGIMPQIGADGLGPTTGGTSDVVGTFESNGEMLPDMLPDESVVAEASTNDGRAFVGERFVPVYIVVVELETKAVLSDNSDLVSIEAEVLDEAIARVTSSLGDAYATHSDDDTGAGTSASGNNATQLNSRGYLDDLKLAYSVTVSGNGQANIALADTSSLLTDLWQQSVIGVLIWLGAMLVFFFISLLLSNIALKPVAAAWEQQRQFISDASHELKTPLTVILANNSLMKAHPTSTVQEQMKWLNSTEAEAVRMDDLVRNLLLLAQTDEEEHTVMADTGATVDLSSLVEQDLLQFEAVLFERNIQLSSTIAADIVIHGREDQLERLIHILLDNASKYASGDPSTVRIELAAETSGKHKARLTVANSGEPIAADTLPHIFDRFYRGDMSHSDTEGAGLGLSMARAIVASHKGVINVTSDIENGTVFTVVL